MGEARKDRGTIRRRVAKLWRVVVVGGAVIGAACATANKAGDGKSGASSGASSGGSSSQDGQGGGARSW